MAKKIFVGMSGGVDSSVTAALLKQQGYDVTGVYMKNWSKNLPGLVCTWQEDYQDAKRVAVQLKIPFKMYDFEKKYRQKVVDYMLNEYQLGHTPNPDVMCNQEIKFKLFISAALEDGADMIATGHYARIKDGQLFTGTDTNKDQSYFLYRVNEEALKHSLMPLGELTKPAVRKLASELGLITATKKDSQGICFVGNIGIKDFLLTELGSQKPGKIIDQTGRAIGQHDGAIFYTIGQRHGLDIGGGLPYYVIGKDMARNEVQVTTDLDDAKLWHSQLTIGDSHWINNAPIGNQPYAIRLRYRAPLVKIKSLEKSKSNTYSLTLAETVRAITPGQSAVIYDGQRVLGGGIIT